MSGSRTDPSGLEAEVERVRPLGIAELPVAAHLRAAPPPALSKDFLAHRVRGLHGTSRKKRWAFANRLLILPFEGGRRPPEQEKSLPAWVLLTDPTR
jgi:hypothetical protein